MFETLELKNNYLASLEKYDKPLLIQYFITLKMSKIDSKFLWRILDIQTKFIKCTDFTGIHETNICRAELLTIIENQKKSNAKRIKLLTVPFFKHMRGNNLSSDEKSFIEAYGIQDELKIIKVLEEKKLLPESSLIQYKALCKEIDDLLQLEKEFWINSVEDASSNENFMMQNR